MTQRTCEHCDLAFEPVREAQRFCSRSCGQLGQRQPKPCSLCGQSFSPRSNRAKFCEICAPRKQSGGSNPRQRIICKQCGKPSLVKPTAVYCSQDCYREARFGPWEKRGVRSHRRQVVFLGRRQAALLRIEAANLGTTGGRPWIAGRCGSCGDTFIGSASLVGLSYCSADCKRREIRRRRRAALRGATVEVFDPQEIFERDGWRCQLCGKLTDRARSVPHPKATVLDHLLPLRWGGEHSRANTQCAHFLCNSIKSEKVYGEGEQLRLIG